MRRMVTELLLPTTCTFVISVSADTKNPLPRPLDVSTRTTAGMIRLTTSSSDGGLGGAGSGGKTGPAAFGTGAGSGVMAGEARAGVRRVEPASRSAVRTGAASASGAGAGAGEGPGLFNQKTPSTSTTTAATRTPELEIGDGAG
jgi:hypothetical protein